MITRIEELTLNAWPAFQTLLLGGWVVRFAGGYTRRANSVWPLYAGGENIHHSIEACEALYRRRGLPAIFKLTRESQPAGLDDTLAQRGYAADAQTSVQLLALENWERPARSRCALSSLPDAAWDQAFARMSGLKVSDQPIHERILASIVPECCYTALYDGDTIAACGVGILQDGWLGLYDIVVAPEHRRKGYGEHVVRDLLAWGKQVGAHSTYLQVMLNNPAGLSLYAKVGYRQAYTYWYRVKG